MSISRKLIEAASGSSGGGDVYVDEVFSTYVYEGTAAALGRTNIENGIDLAGEGGLVWIKSREDRTDHILMDSERGPVNTLSSNKTDEEVLTDWDTTFDSSGFSFNTSNWYVNEVNKDYVSWTFRKSPKFFDCVTYAGTGVAREIPHNLGVEPGMIIIKRTESDGYKWYVYHRSLDSTEPERYSISLNEIGGRNLDSNAWNDTAPTSTAFTVGTRSAINGINSECVAYLFAHDDSDESMIKCGSFSHVNGAQDTIELGWEPQLLLVKSSRSTGNWDMVDTMRGWADSADNPTLWANDDRAEVDQPMGQPTSNGFLWPANSNTQDYIYVAVRRPNKPAEEFDPEELFGVQAITAASDNGLIETGNLVDFGWQYLDGDGAKFFTRSLGEGSLDPTGTAALNTSAKSKFDHMDGFEPWYAGTISTYNPKVAYGFKRQPGFFDVVTWKGGGRGGGTASQMPHNLSAVPEMMWFKDRSSTDPNAFWSVYHESLGSEQQVRLDLTQPVEFTDSWSSTAPTEDSFTIGKNYVWDGLGQDYIAYLFASVPGLCSIGTYDGTGNELYIDCGFTNGARFVLIKRTESSGDWYVHDAVLGINVGNARYMLLNSKSVSNDQNFIDPYSSGFKLTAVENNWINWSTGKYIYMAIA